MEMMNKFRLYLMATLIVIIFSHIQGYAQTMRVQVGDLFYNLSGATASVTTSDIVPTERWGDGRGPSKYTNDTYVIPSVISYEGLDYEVVAIDDWAFAGFKKDAYGYATVNNATGSKAKEIILPPTIKRIGECAFANCTNLIKMVIPANVNFIYSGTKDCSFNNTPLLRELIYLSDTPPSGWYATTKTYVPNLQKYKNPKASKADYSLLPILSSKETSFVYSGTTQDFSLSSNLTGYELKFDTPTSDINVGTYDLTIKTSISNEYITYEFNNILQYTIAPANIIVSTADQSREYGDPDPEFKINYDGLVNNETDDVFESKPTISLYADQFSDVGQYPITISGAKAKNYTFSYTPGVLTILPAPLTASVKSITSQYGYTPDFGFNFEGLKNGELEMEWDEEPIFHTTATLTSPVGEYSVTATAKPKNYELTSPISGGVLTIEPATLRLVFFDQSRNYYEEDPEFIYYYDGFRNGDKESIISGKLVITTTATLESEVGEYDITASGISAPNYKIVYSKGTLTVEPRTLIVKAGPYKRAYGEENPPFELEYEGFAPGQNVNNLTKLPYAYTDATSTSSVGYYDVNITGGKADNYIFSYSRGTLQIVKADQKIVWNQDLTNLAVGEQVELLAYSTSELPLTYSVDDNDVCEIYSVGNKQYLDCKKAGEVFIRASQEGGYSYNPSPRYSKKTVIGTSSSEKPVLTLIQLPVGSVSTAVEWGSSYAFNVQASENWAINAISINGDDYTNRVDSKGTFTTPTITRDTKIIISYYDVNSGVETVETSRIKILGQDDGIRVLNAPLGRSINVYTIDGYLIKSTPADADDIHIPLQTKANYIIKVGEFTSKLRI